MSNILRADLYRLRKGAIVRNTFISTAGLVLLFLFILWVTGVSSDAGSIVATGDEQLSVGIGVVTSTEAMLSSGVGFMWEMLGQNVAAILLLPLFYAVFTDDYNCGAYRNLLSFETGRGKIYIAKLLLSLGVTMLLVVFMGLVAGVGGGIAFGFTGMFTAQTLLRTLAGVLLTVPLYFALVSIGHMITAFTRKSNMTIAVFYTFVLVYSSVIQLVSQSFPALAWLAQIDFLSGINYLTYYWLLPTWSILCYTAFGLGIGLLCAFVGLRRYQTADMP